MRLYQTPGGTWRGTQADAATACEGEGAHKRAFLEIDVPTDKPGLIDWLNANARPATSSEPSTPAPPAAPPIPADYAARAVFEEDLWAAMSLPEQLHFAALAMERARRARYVEP